MSGLKPTFSHILTIVGMGVAVIAFIYNMKQDLRDEISSIGHDLDTRVSVLEMQRKADLNRMDERFDEIRSDIAEVKNIIQRGHLRD